MKIGVDAHQQQKRCQSHAVVHRSSEGGGLASFEGGGAIHNHRAPDIEAARAAFKPLGPANKNQARVKPHPIKDFTETSRARVPGLRGWDVGWLVYAK